MEQGGEFSAPWGRKKVSSCTIVRFRTYPVSFTLLRGRSIAVACDYPTREQAAPIVGSVREPVFSWKSRIPTLPTFLDVIQRFLTP